MLLSEQIQKLERRERALDNLCREMLNAMTMRIQLGQIQFQNKDFAKEFGCFIENWSLARETA